MPSTLRFPRVFVTMCALGLAGALPIACAQGSSAIGLGGGTVEGGGGRESSGASSGEMSSSSSSSTSSSGHTSSSTSSSTSGFSSTSSSSSSSTSGTTSSGNPSSACDTGTCDSCQACSSNTTECSNDFNDCLSDSDCNDIVFCWECICGGDSTCLQNDCLPGEPTSSVDLFETWASCVVCACQQTCAIPASSCP